MTVCAIAIPHLQDAIQAARIGRAVGDVRTIGQAALGFYAETGAAPSTLADIAYDQQIDPWGQAYKYLPITAATDSTLLRTDRFGVPINTYFDLYTLGADGQTAPQLTAAQSQDDVIWGNDGVYLGLALNY